MGGPMSLRELRAERVLSIRDLALQAGVAASTIYLTESGRTTPRPAVVRRLAAVLGVEPRAVKEFRRSIDASKATVRHVRDDPAGDADVDPNGLSPRLLAMGRRDDRAGDRSDIGACTCGAYSPERSSG